MTEPWDSRCHECGEVFEPEAERAEVYLDYDRIRRQAGGQDVLLDDVPESAFGPFVVHADPCYFQTKVGDERKYVLA